VEHLIFAVSFSTIAVILLIFVFVGREALPVLFGQTNSALVQDVIPPEQIDTLEPEVLRRYLGLTRAQFRAMDRETQIAMMELRVEAQDDIPADFKGDSDARLNTAEWQYLLGAHQWEGYDRPVRIWQPVGMIHKYNIIPLIVGSLKVTLIGLLFAVPISLAAALYVSQLASPRIREVVKPGIELLAGIPSVVMGVFALLLLASFLQKILGYQYRLNAFVAGIALGLTAVPLIFSIAEDALTSVPRSYSQAALALGASNWQAAWQVVLPAALPGVFAAVVLGFGRCIGETMVVLIASGNASKLTWSVFDSARTITATIAAEMAEAVAGGHHYQILFLLGTLLFAVTFITNFVGDLIIHRLKGKMEGRA
jgi:phosphate transport system permease protein